MGRRSLPPGAGRSSRASSRGGCPMPISPSAQIHPTALIDPLADLGDDVQVGPFAVLEGPVRLGAGCVVKTGAHLVGPLSMGRGNTVFSHAVLGEQPQHLRYAGESTRVEIGD